MKIVVSSLRATSRGPLKDRPLEPSWTACIIEVIYLNSRGKKEVQKSCEKT